MFTIEEIKEFLKDLKLKETEENIKWAYEMMMKGIKLDLKIKKFEMKYGSLLDSCCGGKDGCCTDHHHGHDHCCGGKDGCCCEGDDCCDDDCCSDDCCCKTNSKSKKK